MKKTIKKDNLLPSVHPGDVLREEFMKPLGLSAYATAKGLGVSAITVSLMIRRKRNVSPEVRAKLARLAKARWAKAKKAGKSRLG